MAYIYCEICGDTWEPAKTADSETYCGREHRSFHHQLKPDIITLVNAANRKSLQEELSELLRPYEESFENCIFWHDRAALSVILLPVVLAFAALAKSLGTLLLGIPAVFVIAWMFAHGISAKLPGVFRYDSICERWDKRNGPRMIRDFDGRFPKGTVNRKKALIALHFWMRQDDLWSPMFHWYVHNIPLSLFGNATADEWRELAYEPDTSTDS